jgi:hypothetical protein
MQSYMPRLSVLYSRIEDLEAAPLKGMIEREAILSRREARLRLGQKLCAVIRRDPSTIEVGEPCRGLKFQATSGWSPGPRR